MPVQRRSLNGKKINTEQKRRKSAALQTGPLMKQPRSSRQRYRDFVRDYKQRRLDEAADGKDEKKPPDAAAASENGAAAEAEPPRKSKRREYLREYFRWLWPHRYAAGAVFLFALFVAGLEMIEPLFMRFIIDNVLLNTELDT